MGNESNSDFDFEGPLSPPPEFRGPGSRGGAVGPNSDFDFGGTLSPPPEFRGPGSRGEEGTLAVPPPWTPPDGSEDTSGTLSDGYIDWSNIFTLGWYYKVPELRDFIDGWIKRLQDPDYEIDPYRAEDLFEAELRMQNWFTTHAEAWITAEQDRLSNPITWEDNLRTHSSDIQTIASNMGYAISEDEASTIADISIHGGYWTDAEIERYILDSQYYDRPSGERDLPEFGSIRTEADYLNQVADGNLVDISGRVDGWAHDIKSERMTREQAEQQIFQLARSGRFSFLGDDRWDQWRSSGMTVRSFVEPLRQTVADTWELDLKEIPLNHTFFNENLVTEEDGKERFANSREVKALAMKSPEYRKTAAYRKRMADFKLGIYKSWGVI